MQHISDNPTQSIRELWQAAFGDEDTFIDSFLLRHYSPRRVLTAECDGHTAAMLHLIPFETQLGRTTYIYGVATAPEFRHRGLAEKLMHKAMKLIEERGDDAAFLIPSEEWLHGFYERFGFEGSLPAEFRDTDGFDFGTGDPARDRAMIWRRDTSLPQPEILLCNFRQCSQKGLLPYK